MACPGATPTNIGSNFYRVCDHDIIFFHGNIRSGPGSNDLKIVFPLQHSNTPLLQHSSGIVSKYLIQLNFTLFIAVPIRHNTAIADLTQSPSKT